jgi:hypothetical protein
MMEEGGGLEGGRRGAADLRRWRTEEAGAARWGLRHRLHMLGPAAEAAAL